MLTNQGRTSVSSILSWRVAINLGQLCVGVVLLIGIALLGGSRVAAAESFQAPPAKTVLTTLKQSHPRLLITPTTADEIKQLIARDALAANTYNSIKKFADVTLTKAPSSYKLPDGKRLLSVSTDVLNRVESLAFVFLMTGDKKYVTRAWAELEAAAKFKDWNPPHFLDPAVMSHAFALGYDWLYQEWTPAQRATLKRALVDFALKPAIEIYRSKKGWPTAENNWNQVCNGGIGLGALAIADEEPELASFVLANAVASIPRSMSFYAPDGGGAEGVTYWGFGSSYNVLLMAALDSALGTDFGLSQIDGFRQSGDYQIFLCGAGRMAFDFGDCALRRVSEPQHFWMARKYDTPRYAWFRYAALRDGEPGDLTDLLWWDPVTTPPSTADLPLDRMFRKVECGSLRDSWIPGKGFLVGLEGGNTDGSHRHLDLGSFILESDGVRWISDSGKETETYHANLNHQDRWDFYRTRAEGHNTLVFNPTNKPDQSPEGTAAFSALVSSTARATTTLDLSRAYPNDVSKLTRTFTLDRGTKFTVSDDITCKQPSTIWSFFHTEATVKLAADKRSATLTAQGKTLKVVLVAPAGATLTVMAAQPLPTSPQVEKQQDNAKFTKLAITLNEVTATKIEVQFVR